MDLGVIFITGLTVGGLTCLAVQGGLLASVIAAKEESEVARKINTRNVLFPTLAFLTAKLIAYTLLGFLLGAFGSLIGISQSVQIAMQFLAGVYMIFVALNLLNIHPIFRYALIQPPRFLAKLVRNQSKSKDLFAPLLLGAMTIFIPCGTTLAMEALAISSGSAVKGAAVLFTFILGTSPLFLGLGTLTSFLGDNFRTKFLKLAAVAVLYLGITSINGSLVAAGSPLTLQSLAQNFPITINSNSQTISETTETPTISQTININITSRGYSPNQFTVKQGQPVQLNLTSKDAYSCASAFRIPSLKIAKNLQPNEKAEIKFTPENKGKITFTCSMGMYSGVINVI